MATRKCSGQVSARRAGTAAARLSLKAFDREMKAMDAAAAKAAKLAAKQAAKKEQGR